MVPGIMGTRLRVQITDCQKLDQDILEFCFEYDENLGEYSCANNFEFDLWVAIGKFSPAGFSSHGCFGAVIALDLNSVDKPVLADKAGVRVTWYGNTPDTLAHA